MVVWWSYYLGLWLIFCGYWSGLQLFGGGFYCEGWLQSSVGYRLLDTVVMYDFLNVVTVDAFNCGE